MNVDIVFFIKSVNKIALLAFFITMIFIVIEIYLLIQQNKKETKPVIPEFKDSKDHSKSKFATLPKTREQKYSFTKPNQRFLLVLISVLVFFGIIYLLGFISNESSGNLRTASKNNQGSITVVSSSGIKLYNQSWKELTEEEISQLKKGDTIIIGIKTIPNLTIDKARIRINKQIWLPQTETSAFKKNEGVYYNEYQIATSDSRLIIEAQLHDKNESWLGQ